MKSFLISDSKDTLVGMRLAGIAGVVAKEREDILRELQKVTANKEIGIILLTENVLNEVKEEVFKIKLKESIPLIVTIPDRHGIREKDFITKYIRESIGIKI
ncbi:V-type ATP synthase subunit F [Sporanaerobacter acetigenes]|uniref:V/A-type H+-transporting ATPase subunit F n=1 Tax=Sporanaerobacter acetigenes DSM 13106 TaxID=1123281 RepID=A0A1M5VVJ0_9FIRM|nr:V-type ATP synthase subunit F [Sporanaerobacter acetigenes]SHH78953.1 V/A-type H+-transporting ATPase subunit F [Sporanaerobacter acetigenes DSM 13106]